MLFCFSFKVAASLESARCAAPEILWSHDAGQTFRWHRGCTSRLL